MRGQLDGAVHVARQQVSASESLQVTQLGQESASEIAMVFPCPGAGGGGMPGPDDQVIVGGHAGMISFRGPGRCLPSWIGHGVEVKVNYLPATESSPRRAS